MKNTAEKLNELAVMALRNEHSKVLTEMDELARKGNLEMDIGNMHGDDAKKMAKEFEALGFKTYCSWNGTSHCNLIVSW